MNKLAHADFDISDEMAKVIPLKPVPSARPNAANLADLHRREAARCAQRATDTRRNMKARIAAFKADERAEMARHAEAMAFIADRIAEVKEQGASDIAEDQKLEAYNRVAIEALAE
jgi:hypothetical protein